MRNILVKIAFVLDCTSSMERWINEAKSKIRQIVNKNNELYPNATFEIALVAYRDYGDLVRFRVVDFSGVNEVIEAISLLRAEGGDDDAEDIAGALDRTCSLTWGPSDVRMIFHIADAPPHGLDFHSVKISDRYPRGDPDGKDLRVFLTILSQEDVEYTFVKITSTTDIMIDVFHSVYGSKFRVIDLLPQSARENMGRAITESVSQTIARYTSSQDM